jgi:O-antigen ligase
MNSRTTLGVRPRGLRISVADVSILAVSLAAGMLLFSLAPAPRTLLAFAASAVALFALLCYPELALALYVVVGDIKGDEHVASLCPIDLTLTLGAILLAGIAINLLRGKRIVRMPPSYFLFVAFVGLMAASLAYTPVFEGGIEKLGRFLTVTGIVIVAPFFVLGTPRAMKRFLIGFGVAAFAICVWSLSALGGSERLVTPSDNTIGLGHVAGALTLLIWFAVIPRYDFPRRMLTYVLLAVPIIALIGSGSRGSAIACGLVILISPFFCRRFWLDLGSVAASGFAALPFLHIPESSFDYLGTLFHARNVTALLNFRGDLLAYGWRLLQQHPLLGAGIGGFRYDSPNPTLYKWPHNIFLEIVCELGIPAGLIAAAIFGSAIREAFRQLRNHLSPQFVLAQLAAALLVAGIVNAMSSGNINSDRSTWLFVILVFVVRGLRARSPALPVMRSEAAPPVPA